MSSNVSFLPNAFNVYDSLGEAYMKAENCELAMENYKESIDLNADNENAKKMLEQLQRKLAGGMFGQINIQTTTLSKS